MFRVGGTRVRVVLGDITHQAVDAVVNAANSTLLGGGGVDGAIHRAGGPAILEECRDIRRTKYPDGLPAGDAVITSSGSLPAKHVIHTVGPVWQGGGHRESEQLVNAYRNSLRVAQENGLKTIAFPAISTGAYGYPGEDAARIAIETVRNYLETYQGLEEVVFVLHSGEDMDLYLRLTPGIMGGSP